MAQLNPPVPRPENERAPRHVLVIDDDPDVCELLQETAHALGLSCSVSGAERFIREEVSDEVSVIFVDLIMPGIDGIEVLRFLANSKTSAGIVVMSGIGNRVVEAAQELGTLLGLNMMGSLHKPFRICALEALLLTIPKTVSIRKRSRPTLPCVQRSDLMTAIEQDQLVLHYQPQIDIKTGTVVGVEALVRWNHPAYGMIYPNDFIPLAEASDLVDRITWVVLAKGLRDKPSFVDQFGSSPRLSLNITAGFLRHLDLPETLSALLVACNVRPEELILEITESGLVDDLSQTLEVMSRLCVRGITLSIDDFGTGYSMMRQLRTIPATELKIDKAFVAGMAIRTSDRIMVQKTIEIGHELGMRVIAEGVETEQQLAALRLDDCDVAQGYFFARPLPLPQFLVWLSARRSAASDRSLQGIELS